MGSIPNCICYTNKKYVLIESDLYVDNNNMEVDSYIYNKEFGKMNISNSRDKMDSDINRTTLSPQNNFINPLPDIVIIKFKKHF